MMPASGAEQAFHGAAAGCVPAVGEFRVVHTLEHFEAAPGFLAFVES